MYLQVDRRVDVARQQEVPTGIPKPRRMGPASSRWKVRAASRTLRRGEPGSQSVAMEPAVGVGVGEAPCDVQTRTARLTRSPASAQTGMADKPS